MPSMNFLYGVKLHSKQVSSNIVQERLFSVNILKNYITQNEKSLLGNSMHSIFTKRNSR